MEVQLLKVGNRWQLTFASVIPYVFQKRLKAIGFKINTTGLTANAPSYDAYKAYGEALIATDVTKALFVPLTASCSADMQGIKSRHYFIISYQYLSSQLITDDYAIVFENHQKIMELIVKSNLKALYGASLIAYTIERGKPKNKAIKALKQQKVWHQEHSKNLLGISEVPIIPDSEKQASIPEEDMHPIDQETVQELEKGSNFSEVPIIPDSKKQANIPEKDMHPIDQETVQELEKGSNFSEIPMIPDSGKQANISENGTSHMQEEKAFVNSTDPDAIPAYVSQLLEHMRHSYFQKTRLTASQIRAFKETMHLPNMGTVWELVELSWLRWYQAIYKTPSPFYHRLQEAIAFWKTGQPTYTYSDSSKETYKQYSTPCPIGMMIAQYTQMATARRIFEPSAGNGLLVVGASPAKTHVNEIDSSRLKSLRLQHFDTITSLDASQPFPSSWEKQYDVMVTNPPFAPWEVSKEEKTYMVQQYFKNMRGLEHTLRLEHLMAGLALRCLTDQGRAVLILKNHLQFNSQGFLERYRSFYHWLCRHYHVEDVINLNGFTLYNKQGAVTPMHMVLIKGRKEHPTGLAPTQEQAPKWAEVIDDFELLWQRITTHIPLTYNKLIHQLQLLKQLIT